MNTENKPTTDNKQHSISIMQRQKAHLTGILEVISFDAQEVILETVCGTLSIDGGELRLTEWNTENGTATLLGQVDAITYFDKKTSDGAHKSGLLGKLFK